MKTGNTSEAGSGERQMNVPQWSPVMKTGNTQMDMSEALDGLSPQWSPVMKTGNTRGGGCATPGRFSRLNGARS